MNFKEWYESIGGDDDAFCYARSVKDVSEQSWAACKKEVLRILEADTRINKGARHENYASGNINKINEL